jgi:DNA polymerase III alpha subunit (gram-positive type)
MTRTLDNQLNLLDFGIIGDQLSIGELLHSSYKRGREDLLKEIKKDFKNNLQSAAQSSSLLKSKLSEVEIEVNDMYIKVVDFNKFKCLVVLKSEDFYLKTKRRQSYKISEHINNTNNRIELEFSIMSNSEEIEVNNITSDGFLFKYGRTE